MVVLMAGLRQLRYPWEFRIPPSETIDLEMVLRKIAWLAGDVSVQSAGAESMQYLAEVGTGLWRLQRKMMEPGTDHPTPGMRRACRSMKEIWNDLARVGVMILDHTDTIYTANMPLRVLTFEKVAGFTQARVIQTARPTIFLQERPIQMGEVVVGLPGEEE